MASNDKKGTAQYRNGQSATKQEGTGYKQKVLTPVSQLTLANTVRLNSLDGLVHARAEYGA